MVHHNGRPDIFKGPATKYDEEELRAVIHNEETPVFVCTDEKNSQSSKEDYLIHKFEKFFSVPVPKLAKKKNLLKSPILIAILLVVFILGGFFIYTVLFNDKGNQKKRYSRMRGCY